ncbi:MAG TPA: RHS repeat-associated core domain-containing protein [Ktedonobacteraceae bacterium]|nr:RHS repeat-associated core domain-containing protein [Ktedonobacteraceae bacterium]
MNGPTTSYSYNTANELTSKVLNSTTTTYAYDANGNLTGNSGGLSISYNAQNQSTSMNGTTNSYTSADQTQRVASGSTSAVYTQLGLDSETSSAGTTYYIRCSCSALAGERTPTGTYYYLFDGLGSVVGLTNSTGAVVATYAYDPYGNLTSSTGTVSNPWRYASGYYDSFTSFYKFGIRYYDPSTGRWTQRMPIGGSLQELVKANPYTYADNNPTNEVDPTGKLGCFTVLDRGIEEIISVSGLLVVLIGLLVYDAATGLIGISVGIVLNLINDLRNRK